MSGIFLSYRRDDSAGWAGRLHEHLLREWGPDEVFMDIDAIAPGEDFREAVARTMDTCDVVLVVIGPSWLVVTDHAGTRRLDDEGDNHRAEVVAALHADVRVVPVLVGGATMPTVADLPEAMRDLAFRNAAVIEDRRFTSDVRALQQSIKDYIESRGEGRGGGDARPRKLAAARPRPVAATARGTTRPVLPTALAVGGLTALVIWGVLLPRDWHPELSGLRIASVLLVVVVVAVGLRSGRWSWVVAGAIGGLVGLGLWMIQLLSTGHSVEDLLSLGTDGVPNLVTGAAAVVVLVAGLIGLRAQQGVAARDAPAQ